MSFGKIHTQLYIGPPLSIFPIFDGTYVPVPNRIHCVRRLRDLAISDVYLSKTRLPVGVR